MAAIRSIPVKKLGFALVTLVLFFATGELILWIAGVETRARCSDSAGGLPRGASVFERQGDLYRTRNAALDAFNDQSFAARKPTDGLRVFCLGGSSGYGFPWGSEAAFCGVLQDVLTEAYPRRTVEVVNASGMSYGIRRLRRVADELMHYDPDLFVVYSGHNEFVEQSVLESMRERGLLRDAVETGLSHSRVFAFLHTRLRSKAKARPPGPTGYRVRRFGLDIFDARGKARIAAGFERELSSMIAAIHEHGIPVILATVPCNLREWHPERSKTSVGFSDSEFATWRTRLLEGRAQVESGEIDRALDTLEQARVGAPDFAETHYWIGKAYEARARWREAAAAYETACDLDASPVRRTGAINDATRRVAATKQVPLLDVDRLFAEESEHGLVGFNLIEDYVHPTLFGHQRIAWYLWKAIEAELKPQAGGLPDRALFERVVSRRRAEPQPRLSAWFYNQGVVLERQDQRERAMTMYRQALDLEPTYVAAMLNLAILLSFEERLDEAQRLADAALTLDPSNPSAHLIASTLAGHRGEWEIAAEGHREVLRLESNNVAALIGLGTASAWLERPEEARSNFERALELAPENAEANFNLATLLLTTSASEPAQPYLERALRTDPEHADAHNNLGALLLEQGRIEDAELHFRQAVALRPERVDYQFNLGLAMEAGGRTLDAERAFRRVVELSPDHAGALRHLD